MILFTGELYTFLYTAFIKIRCSASTQSESFICMEPLAAIPKVYTEQFEFISEESYFSFVSSISFLRTASLMKVMLFLVNGVDNHYWTNTFSFFVSQ